MPKSDKQGNYSAEIFQDFRSVAFGLTYQETNAALRSIAVTSLTMMKVRVASSESEQTPKRTLTIHKITQNLNTKVQRIISVGAYPYDQKSLSDATDIKTGLVGKAISKKEPVYAPDVNDEPDYLPIVDQTNSELIVPIIDYNGSVLGVLNAESDTCHDFTDSEDSRVPGQEYIEILNHMANLCLLVFQLNSQRQLQGNYNHAIKKILDLDKRGSSSEIEMGYIRPLHDLLASILTCLANEMGTTSVSLIFKKEDEAIAWPFVSLDLDDIEENFSDAILEKEIQFKDCWLRYVFNSDAEKILECDNKNITDIFGVDQGILKDSIGDIPIAKCYGFTIPVIFKSEANGLKLKAAILLLSQTQKTKPPEFPDFYSQLIQKAFYNIALIREEFADIKHLEFILKIEKIAEEIGEWNSKFLRKVSDEIRTQFNLDGCLIYHAFNVNSILYPAAYSGVGQESKIMDAHYKFNSQRNQGEIGEAANSESTVYIPSPPKELTRHYHLPKLHKPSLFIVPIRYQEKLLAVISCLRFTTQFIEEDRVFSTPLSVPIFNKIALSLGRIFRNQMDQTVYKERQLYMEGLVKHLHELNGASSKDFLFIKLHEVVSKVLPLENQFFCIFTVNSEEERKSSKETKTLTVFSESRVALKQKLREQGKFFESFEFPKFVEDEGLTGRLLNPKNTSEPVEFHPMVEDAGKPECIRFWNAVGCR